MNNDDKKKLGVVILALGAGVLAAVLTGNYIRNESAARAKQYEQKKLLPLMKENEAQNRKIRNLEQALQQAASQMAEARTRRPNQQESQAPLVSLSEKTPPGKRAVSIKIDSLSAVGGLVNPGDYVDVLARLKVPRKNFAVKTGSNSVTTVLFQNVQILAVDSNVGAAGSYEKQQKSSFLVVTMALNPEESGLMSFAQQNGQLQLFLRSPAESQTYILQASDWQSLSDYIEQRQGVNINPPPPTAEAAQEKPYIQIFKGGQEL